MSGKERENFRTVPEDMPPPSYAPILAALGIALVFWSLLTGVAILFAGLSFLVAATSIWIKEITL